MTGRALRKGQKNAVSVKNRVAGKGWRSGLREKIQ